MRKTQIAIATALAAFASVPAFAQSNVQIYGVADVSFESVRASGNGNAANEYGNRTRVQSNSSYIGFRGTEDLGNGLKAAFQIETGVNMDDGGTSTFGTGRDTYVGLSGNYGTVAAGYLSHPYRSALVGMDVVPGSAGVGSITGIMGNLNDQANLGIRSQAIAYISPSFGGLHGAIAYTGNEDKDDKAKARATGNPYGVSMSLTYENGPFKAVYAHTSAQDILAGADSTVKGHLLGGSYNFEQGTTVGVVYETIKNDQAGNAYDKRGAWGLNAKHVLGQHEFAAAYYKAGDVKTQAGDLDGSDARQVTLRYGYNMSKRTQVYGIYSQIKNGSAANYRFGNASAIENASNSGNDHRSVGVGIRHSF